MNCFKNQNQSSTIKLKKFRNQTKFRSNELNVIFKKFGKAPIKNTAYDQQKLGELILEKTIDFRFQRNNILILELLKSNIVDVNNIKNFLNQTLLHFASENNDIELCTYLLKYGADCLLEDNYRQTPFIIAAKLDSLELLDLFTNEIKKHPKQSHNLNKQIRAASYHACNFGNLRIIKYLFDQFGLHSEDLINEFNRTNQDSPCDQNRSFELNVLHVACYKANIQIAEFLLDRSLDEQAFINTPINDYRSSTSLEEALKGYLCLQPERTPQPVEVYLNQSRTEFHGMINLLIEKNAKFSKNFIQNNGLSKLVSSTFTGSRKDLDFVHLLYVFSYLFKFKLCEIFYHESTSPGSFCNSTNSLAKDTSSDAIDEIEKYSNKCLELSCKMFDMERTIDEFLLKIYLISQRVIKDYKQYCLKKYVELVFTLHYSGQLKIQVSKLAYLKERNAGTYELIKHNVEKPLSLKWLSVIAIRSSISMLGANRINSLVIPTDLKRNLFLENIPIVENLKSNIFTNLF